MQHCQIDHLIPFREHWSSALEGIANFFDRSCWHVILGPITEGRRGPEEALRHSAWGATKRPLKMVDHSGLTGYRLRYFMAEGE